jgi:hypothetical protein
MAELKTCNMVFEAIGRTLVVVHSRDFPSDAEWDAYLQALLAHISEWKDRRSLVLTEGGAPSSKQRARMSEVVADSAAPTAVLTGSPAVRATVGALNLRNSAIRAFGPEEIGAALQHLGLGEDERRHIVEALPALQQQVGRSASA